MSVASVSRQPVRRGRRVCAVAAATVAMLTSGMCRGATPADVQRAIEHGRDFLFARQQNGNWEVIPKRNPAESIPYGVENRQWGGLTALTTLALIASGVPSTEPHVQQGIAFLRNADLHGTYAVSLRAQVWGLLPPEPWVRECERRDLQLLGHNLHAGRPAGVVAGLYGYDDRDPVTDGDHSASQFGVLGTWALEQAGVEVPTSYWQLVDTAWRRQQLPNGGWSYLVKPRTADAVGLAPDASMAAAGVATLSIAQDFTQVAARCSGNLVDPNVTAGLKYLGDNLNTIPGSIRQNFILFGISRVGLATGLKYIGTTDWFRWGSDLLCAEQAPSGAWDRAQWNENVNNVPNTAFALLFLSRGRAPLMISKLQYDLAGPTAPATARNAGRPVATTWNQRPRDVANLTRWVGRQIESSLNWQVVSLRQSRQDLHDAPILFMSGSKLPGLSQQDVDTLRTFAEDGGVLVGHADCGANEFAKGFEQLGQQMFPGRSFRPLEPTSPILAAEQFSIARSPALAKCAVRALSNGTRELMLLLPSGDPGRNWQTQSFQAVKSDVYGQLMIDLFLYAVDKEGLRHRGATYLVDRDAKVANAARSVTVARVKFGGNWDPEPGGWRRLANVTHNAGLSEVTVVPFAVGPGSKLDAATAAVASLTFAEANASLTDVERDAIRSYVNSGGTLFVDVAGGRSEYRTAAETEIAKLFPATHGTLPVLPPGEAVFSSAGSMWAVGSVDFRRFNRTSGSSHTPLLRGLTMGDRVAVFYTPEDVSVGLLGQPIDGVAGYVPADATKIVANIISYAAMNGRNGKVP